MTLRVRIGKYDMFGLAGMGVGDWFRRRQRQISARCSARARPWS
jgi:hypothetical protein